MNQYKIVVSSEKNKPKFLNLKCPEPNCVNLGYALYTACNTADFRELLKTHKLVPATNGVKDRITILASFDSDSTKSLTGIKVLCQNQVYSFNKDAFLNQFKKLLS